MKCFNCEMDIIDVNYEICPNCLAKLNVTKNNFISYIGSPNSLSGYQKSYKLILLKFIIKALLEVNEAPVSYVIENVKKFYFERYSQGLKPDFDVDVRIAQIENSSDYDVFAVIKSQPFKVINEKGYLFINRNSDDKLIFVFNEDIVSSMTYDEWRKLLRIIESKIILYYSRYDNLNTSANPEFSGNNKSPKANINSILDTKLLISNITNLSVRTKNILMRNGLFTISDLLEFVEAKDLHNLKNLGEKTYKEICELLVFPEKSIPIKKADTNKKVVHSNAEVPQPDNTCFLNINKSNENLELSYLKYADIAPKIIERLFVNGYTKIGDLNNLTMSGLYHIFGRTRSSEISKQLYTYEKPLIEITSELLLKNKNNREFEIYIKRANNKTLQEIAEEYDMTRERIRQIESKFAKWFEPLFSSLVKNYMSENNLSYINTQDVLEIFDDDDFDTVIMYTLKNSDSLEFLSFADMFVKKQNATQDTKSTLHELTLEFVGEGISFFDNLPKLADMLNDFGLDYISEDAFLNYLIEINACFYGDYVTLKPMTLSKRYTIIVNKYFKDGINLYSDEDINLLREYVFKEFGECNLPKQNRAIGARLADSLVICDRGKAKSAENIHFELSVIEDIKRYIDSSKFKTLYFSEIFNEFEGILTFTSDINTHQGLHGILSYLYKDEYEFSRDCLTKKNSSKNSLSLSERIVLLIKESGKAMTRAELNKKIGGLSDIMLFSAINNSNTLMQWDYNYYNAIDNLNITTDDTIALQNLLEDVFEKFKGYCESIPNIV